MHSRPIAGFVSRFLRSNKFLHEFLLRKHPRCTPTYPATRCRRNPSPPSASGKKSSLGNIRTRIPTGGGERLTARLRQRTSRSFHVSLDSHCFPRSCLLETERTKEAFSRWVRRYEDRLETLANVRGAGISVCSGGIIGLGEADQDRVGLLHTLATLPEHPESVPVNALVAVAGTPLEGNKPPSGLEMVRCVATARILMPQSMVRPAWPMPAYQAESRTSNVGSCLVRRLRELRLSEGDDPSVRFFARKLCSEVHVCACV